MNPDHQDRVHRLHPIATGHGNGSDGSRSDDEDDKDESNQSTTPRSSSSTVPNNNNNSTVPNANNNNVTNGNNAVRPRTPQRNPLLVTVERQMERILREALQPLYDFVGMFSVRAGDKNAKRYYNRYDDDGGFKLSMGELQSPIIKGANTIEDFIEKNSHIGTDLLNLATLAFTNKTPLINAQLPSSVEDERTIRDALYTESLGRVKKDWVFGAVEDQIFTFILNNTCWGAMQLGLDMVKRNPNCRNATVKQAICSEGVRGQYALLCAYQFLLASGGSAYAGGANVAGGTIKGANFMLSAGIETRNRLETAIHGALIWFSFVYPATNPAYQKLEDYIQQTEAENRALLDTNRDEQVRRYFRDIVGVHSDPIDRARRHLKATNPAVNDTEKLYLDNIINLYIARKQLSKICKTILVKN